MSLTIPTPEQFSDMTWEQIEPLYTSLVERELPNDDATKAWLQDWNDLDTSLMEAASVANVAVSCDSQNEEKEARHLRFSSEIMPQRGKIANSLIAKLLDSGYAPEELETVLRRARTDQEIFREENVPLKQELSKLTNAYNKIAGAMTVEWEGEDVPLSRLNPFMQHPDRDVRERAWRLHFCHTLTSGMNWRTSSTSSSKSASRSRRTQVLPTTVTTFSRRNIATITRQRIPTASTMRSSKRSYRHCASSTRTARRRWAWSRSDHGT